MPASGTVPSAACISHDYNHDDLTTFALGHGVQVTNAPLLELPEQHA